jgi:hypothetical protein
MTYLGQQGIIRKDKLTGFNLSAYNSLKKREKEYRINMVKEHLP